MNTLKKSCFLKVFALEQEFFSLQMFESKEVTFYLVNLTEGGGATLSSMFNGPNKRFTFYSVNLIEVERRFPPLVIMITNEGKRRSSSITVLV